jgi:hypothetical protein
MDVVRNNIELIGGAVDLKSTSPAGTTFVIKIPLTLAFAIADVVNYFSKVERGWEISTDIRARVTFCSHNLLQNAAPRRFDVIFCRNVLI